MLYEFARHLLILYAFVGLLVAGGLFFQRDNVATIFLGAFVLLFSLEQLDFLYVTGSLLANYPAYYMLLFPSCLLFGPLVWWHIRSLTDQHYRFSTKDILHLIPFFGYTIYTVFLFTMSGAERMVHVEQHFFSEVMPLNYIKAIHVTIYAVALLVFFLKQGINWSRDHRFYVQVIVFIYGITAVLQAYLTLFAEKYIYFINYFLLVSSLVLFIGYMLFFRPKVLQRIQAKYLTSGLSQGDIQRIANKIESYFLNPENFTNPKANLKSLCESIDEKKHHVSQTFSTYFESSFSDFINKHRIDHAKQLLQHPNYADQKILAIGIESGFMNKVSFNRSFLKFAHCTPSEFRKSGNN